MGYYPMVVTLQNCFAFALPPQIICKHQVVLKCWSLKEATGIFFKPQKSIILKGFSADNNKPIKTHCPSSFQQIRTISE